MTLFAVTLGFFSPLRGHFVCLNTALLIIFACAQCQDQFFMCIIPYAASVESQKELCLSSRLISLFLPVALLLSLHL